MQKVRSIQVLRGLAALGVVVCHATDFPLGAAGVDIFFVISGFIISQVMLARTPREFAVDRLKRIYPIYWLMAAPWVLAAASAGILPLDRLVATITLWPIVGGYARPVLLPAWTLCYEMLFYAAVTVGLATGRWRLILAAFATCFVAEFFVGSALLSYLGNPLILEFLMGVLIGRLAVNDGLVAVLFVLACVMLALSPAYQFYDMAVESSGMIALSRVWWWGLPAAAIVLFALRLEREADFPRPLVYLGDVSYSLYLVQTLVMVPVETWSPLLKVALAVVAGIAVHEIFEKRLLNIGTNRKPFVASRAGSEVPVT